MEIYIKCILHATKSILLIHTNRIFLYTIEKSGIITVMKKYNRVKAALFEKNVKQSELADHLGKSRASVYRICDNRSQPHLAELHRIATYLNIPVCDLINDPPE